METHIEKRIRKEKQEKEKQEIENTLFKLRKKDFNVVALTPEGKHLFRFLLDFCHFHRPVLTTNPKTGDINLQTTSYLEGRRSLYLDLRKYIKPKFLKEIEFEEGEEE